MPNLLQGTLTFLFTDIEGSTQLWERYPEEMKTALVQHDDLLRTCIEQNEGNVVKTTGDGFYAVFNRAGDGVACAVAAQRSLAAETWDEAIGQLHVRMALHTGAAEERDGDYFGPPVNRAARLMSAAHGGQTLLSQITRELVRKQLPEDVTLSDLGDHRLKDLSRSEHVFQLLIRDLPSDFPPIRSLDATRTNLPVQTTSFVGREDEIVAITELLAEPNTRLVSLVAPGGTGKTRLAIEVAALQSENFADGVYLAQLAPLSDSEEIVQAVIEALSIAITSGDDLKTQLLHYLRRKHLLLVMDNFEHLLEGAVLLNEILEAASGVTILATSREKLNLTGETVLTIDGLQFADWQTLEEARQHSACQLFLQAAQRSLPDFQLIKADVPHLAHICQLVHGIPLAILLAAAWVDSLSLQEIASEIEKSLDFLETELRDIPARQRSIRAVLEGSWERLDQADREHYVKLSIFRGGFTRQAAEEVAGASMQVLARLVAKSFLRRDPEQGRYHVHELLRQFAAELLEASSEDSLAAQEAHITYFTNYMEEMLPALRSERQKTTLDEIEADIENVRLVWLGLAVAGRSSDMGRIIDTLWYFHEIRGWYHAGHDLFTNAESTLEALPAEEETEIILARIMAIKGFFITMLGSPQEGRELAEKGMLTLQRFGLREEKLISLLGMFLSALFLHKGPEILEAAKEILEIANEIEHSWWQADGQTVMGSGSMATGAFEDARHYSEVAVEKWAQIGDPCGSIWPAISLGGLAAMDGDYAQAKERYQFAIKTAQSINFRRGLQYNYNNLGHISFTLKDYSEAEQNYLQSLAINDEIGQTRELLVTLYDIARVWAVIERPADAVELLAIILRHPARDQHGLFRANSIQTDAEQLRTEFEAALEPAEYSAAWQRGQSAELDDAVAELLA